MQRMPSLSLECDEWNEGLRNCALPAASQSRACGWLTAAASKSATSYLGLRRQTRREDGGRVEEFRTKEWWTTREGRQKGNKDETRKRKGIHFCGYELFSRLHEATTRLVLLCSCIFNSDFYFVFNLKYAIWFNILRTGYVSRPQSNKWKSLQK